MKNLNNTSFTLLFSSIGHAFMHMFAAFYFVIILTIEKEWSISYDQLIRLWSLGALLIGLGAIPFGWLSDRWSRSGTMTIMFIGMGLASILCGSSTSISYLFISLSLLGLFCSIYHPVGIPWVIHSSNKQGRALGINGIFGGVGIGSGAFVAGTLTELLNWQLAFILPGFISIIIGFILIYFIFINKISYKNVFINNIEQDHSRNEMILISLIMLISMFALGLTFHNTQTALPKVFEIRIDNINSIQIGLMIGIIYFISGATTFIGGLLADRFNLKTIYLIGIFLQFPCYLGIAYVSGYSLVVLCILAAVFNASILPTENLLLSKFTPQKYHGVVYGIKFILAFGSGPISVFLISEIYSITLEFTYLFLINAIMMGLVSIFIIFLPIQINQKVTN
tara:strand:+ start:131 stop:1315 length:1185 start_codon:yes stop_codon:yes gene_type:complete